MSLKKYLLAGGLSTVLLLGACNGDDTSTEEETDDAATEETDDAATDDAADDEEEEDAEEDTDTEDDSSADGESSDGESSDGESSDGESSDGEITYSGEYGDFTVASFEQYTLEPEEAEEEDEEEEEEEEAEPKELVLIEYEYTNTGDVPTSAEEAFGLDLAVRQMAETGDSTLENLTMDLPDDHESADLAAQSIELVEPGESSTALVAYGPLDTSLETALQSRNDEELNETIELEGGDEAADDEEEEESEE